MQKILVVLSVLYGGFCGISYATTVNYNWLVDGTNYAQTTCETGDDLILPTPAPTKYGYHFVGWVESEISGSWSQSGIPTPQNPIEPVFKPFSNTVLRAVGSGDDFVADSYDPETRTITRRIGVKVFDGTEGWVNAGSGTTVSYLIAQTKAYFAPDLDTSAAYNKYMCSHLKMGYNDAPNTLSITDTTYGVRLGLNTDITGDVNTKLSNAKQWLADQYNAGTPVTVYYPLATPTEERIQ